MKKLFVLLLILGTAMNVNAQKKAENPFFGEYKTPFQTPPFDKINNSHYMPAIEKGLLDAAADIKRIVDNKAEPNFKNTIEALEFSGKLLNKVTNVFYNLYSSNSDDEMVKIAQEIAPKMSKYSDDISLNEKLFERIRIVYDNIDKEKLNPEQKRLVDKYFKDFARNGALLSKADQTKLRKINEDISVLSLKYGENLLAETNSFKLYIERPDELAGLPESIKESAKEKAKADNNPAGWLFTLHNSSVMPFLQYSDNRELRRKILDAYLNRGNNNNDFDNKFIINKLVNLRQEKARLLGYPNFAEYTLETSMAKNSAQVMELLNRLWEPSRQNAVRESQVLQEYIDSEGKEVRLEAQDWRYYSEKVKQKQFSLSDEELRPYFKLENVLNGAFFVAGKLWGIKFKELTNVPVYHKDVKVYEVTEENGKHIGVFYTDYFARNNKKGGAWMNNLRETKIEDGKMTTPLVVNVCNFTPPTGDKPSLLTFDEAETLFHEFGHALHGLFANNAYPSIGGTSVPRDFVELPSQIMENWFSQPDVLREIAKHYETGLPMPEDYYKKIEASSKFNQGFATVEYLAASLLDMKYYTDDTRHDLNVTMFEEQVKNEIGLMPEIPFRYRSTYFSHIFSGGYSAGYYSYIWAGVLDSDAFEAFLENGLFDRKTANSFRKNVLERGNTDEPMELYKAFRGQEPQIEPLLKKRGLI